MFCSKCGTENEKEAQTCIKCGAKINERKSESVKFDFKEIINYLLFLVKAVIRPTSTFKNKKDKYDNFKDSAILCGIVSLIMTIITLISTMINTVRVANYTLFEGYTYTWDLNRLGTINYLSVIFKNFFIYAIVLFAIAGLFYIASLIIKKEVNYFRLLNIATVAIIPLALGSMVVYPILHLIWIPLAMVASVVTLIYTIVIFTTLNNAEFELKGEKAVYFNTICYSILLIALSYAIIKLSISSISSISSLLNLIK